MGPGEVGPGEVGPGLDPLSPDLDARLAKAHRLGPLALRRMGHDVATGSAVRVAGYRAGRHEQARSAERTALRATAMKLAIASAEIYSEARTHARTHARMDGWMQQAAAAARLCE